MSLSLGRTLRESVDRFASRAGLLLVAAYLLLMIPYQLSINGLFEALLFRIGVPDAQVGLTYPAPTPVYGVAIVVLLLLTSALSVVAVRTFVAGETGRIPREFYTRRMLWTTGNLIVGGLAFGLIVFLGTLALVLPGIVAYVGLVFMTMYVAAEDENFVVALKHSWQLARTDFLTVGLLVLVLVLGAGVFGGVVGTLVGFAAVAAGVPQGVINLLTIVVVAPVSLFGLALLSTAFDHLRSAADDGGPPKTGIASSDDDRTALSD
jgi:hypothetical protein